MLAERWLAHFRGSLDLTVSDALARETIYEQVRLLYQRTPKMRTRLGASM